MSREICIIIHLSSYYATYLCYLLTNERTAKWIHVRSVRDAIH